MAAFADARLDSTEASHAPTRVKMCDGIWSACGDDGAIAAKRSAALSPLAAMGGKS
jgi:hypothetical protein